ncbi:MAG: Ger(x)C family spore germination C-terminal domain-containing protein [Clostridia bacterium]|nr:Ger(x)C family spore germination C-terminal domain-containing protein [Clostridia bacterium]
MKRPHLKRSLSILYVLIFIALTFLFFTNDFGLLDLRKTSVVIGVALDINDGEVELTAQLAVPQPAENGENTKFNVVSGNGATVAAALNDVNVKTGYYPKLVFCKLIILGESCFNEDLTRLLDYFYRNEYTGLTLSVAACQGNAGELIGQQFPCGNSATDVIDKLLSSEAQASGNVTATTLKKIGETLFSKSGSAYMPYLENGILEDSEGGGEEGGGGSGGSGGGGGNQQCGESELTCDKCAIFRNGYCAGVLPQRETFVLSLIENEVNHAFMESGEGEDTVVLGLRNCKGEVGLKFEKDKPVVEFKFKATAKVQDSAEGFSPKTVAESHNDKDVLKQGEQTLSMLFNSLVDILKQSDCDALGLRTKLYKQYYGKFEKYGETLLNDAQIKCDIKLKSAG